MIIEMRPGLLGFIISTRAALAFGVGLLAAERIPEERRRSIALTLIAIGAVTTVPAVRAVLSKRVPEAGLTAA